jgi:hypothetical protein
MINDALNNKQGKIKKSTQWWQFPCLYAGVAKFGSEVQLLKRQRL